MTISRSEDLLFALVALALVPAIAFMMRRGLRAGRMPIGRAYVRRDERPGGFNALFLLYIAAMVFLAIMAADLILNLGLRSAL
jgi:hypothetical protein